MQAAKYPKKPRPVTLYREIRDALSARCRVEPGDTLLVACSGGADSLALLVALSELARRRRLRLVVAHLDHGLRASSRGDATSVARRARKLGLPIICGRVAARKEMKRRGLSGEDGLRILRREFLCRAAREAGADVIVLAHTADDQAETVLLRLIRGTGIAGLGAMRWRRGRWIRPLLGVTREKVLEFLRERRVRPRQDPSNRDRRISRNRVRLDVMPILRRLNPQVSLTLAATAERFQDLSSFLDRSGKRALRQALAGNSNGGIRLVRKRLLGYHPAIRENVIRQAWERENPGAGGLTRRHLRAIEELLIRGVGKSLVHLPDKRVARLERGHLFFAPNSRPRPGSASRSAGPVRKRNRR